MGGFFAASVVRKAFESTAPVVTEEERKAKKARSALYATEGGVQGQELAAGEVNKRNTLLGN